MKIKKIEIENNSFFGNVVFDFTDENGQVYDNIVLAGENGCGKTQLLNLIYEFSTLPTGGKMSDEIRKFVVVLTQEELSVLVGNTSDLVNSNGEFEITQIFSARQNTWGRIKVKYLSIQADGTNIFKNIDAYSLFEHEENKAIFKSLYSTVEINYNPEKTSRITSQELDEDVKVSLRSGGDLATSVQQLLIDVQANDANELHIWVDEHPGIAPPPLVSSRRITRFKNAFSTVFDNLNYYKIISVAGQKKVLFKKRDVEVDISSLSSGEKQIVFRGAFLLKNQRSARGCTVLIDEPEISLHPTWQQKIFTYYQKLFIDDDIQTSQILMATHSQYVLRSALENRANTLIILMKHNSNGFQINRITAPLVLPNVTSAELNYVAFNIISIDYHIALYGYLQDKVALTLNKSTCSLAECDTYIKQQSCYDSTKHEKNFNYILYGQSHTDYTLPTYIRNAIDHPDSGRTYTNLELICSINLLIELCR